MPTISNIEGIPHGVDKPHLALYTEGQHGLATAIPLGAVMAVITDARRADGIQKLVLVGVSKSELTFRCICNPRCHAVFTYRLDVKGQHRG